MAGAQAAQRTGRRVIAVGEVVRCGVGVGRGNVKPQLVERKQSLWRRVVLVEVEHELVVRGPVPGHPGNRTRLGRPGEIGGVVLVELKQAGSGVVALLCGG
jgi:hypothetical protein